MNKLGKEYLDHASEQNYQLETPPENVVAAVSSGDGLKEAVGVQVVDAGALEGLELAPAREKRSVPSRLFEPASNRVPVPNGPGAGWGGSVFSGWL